MKWRCLEQKRDCPSLAEIWLLVCREMSCRCARLLLWARQHRRRAAAAAAAALAACYRCCRSLPPFLLTAAAAAALCAGCGDPRGGQPRQVQRRKHRRCGARGRGCLGAQWLLLSLGLPAMPRATKAACCMHATTCDAPKPACSSFPRAHNRCMPSLAAASATPTSSPSWRPPPARCSRRRQPTVDT